MVKSILESKAKPSKLNIVREESIEKVFERKKISNTELITEFRKRLKDNELKLVNQDWSYFEGVVFVKDLTSEESNKVTAFYNNERKNGKES